MQYVIQVFSVKNNEEFDKTLILTIGLDKIVSKYFFDF